MVFCREGENERPPLSLILPHLYLGAERDVTQDSLSAKGISYVLSVSRCSPQPTFLPVSQYLRIPIDDSLRDDLLPWIPAALRFIDGAMSSGSAVLVHCAAGISRSPALAVAYIMYSMGLDLDHAYRFVKERRPSISPNFNFLGQLQHFQGSLSQKSSDGRLIIQPLSSPDTNPSPLPSPLPSPSPCPDHQGKLPPAGDTHGERQQTHADDATLRGSRLDEAQKSPSEAARSLNRKLQTLNLTLNLTQSALTLGELPSPRPRREATTPTGKPLALPHLLPPAATATTGHTSLLEKRRSLTLSLSTAVPPTPHLAALTPRQPHPAAPQTQGDAVSVPGPQAARVPGPPSLLPPAGGDAEPAAAEARGQRQRGSSSSSRRNAARPAQGRAPGGSRARGKSPRRAQNPTQKADKRKEVGKGEACRRPLHSTAAVPLGAAPLTAAAIVDRQPSAETKKNASSSSPRCPEENVVEDQSPLSPLHLTISKLLGWGERMLLGVLLGPQIKMGQAALPYRC